jgi:GTP-binding protein HflX
MKGQPKEVIQGPMPAVLVCTVPAAEKETEEDRVGEMRSLMDTAGRVPVAEVRQHVAKITPRTYIGSGKVEELVAAVKEHGAKEVVFDVQLSPSQQRNLEEATGCHVFDYDELILEIFAQNARTHQARLAVELASMEYTRSRLKRMWTHLDRQSVGTSGMGSGALSGTGEKQIEMDRRLVRKRIQVLRDELAAISARTDRVVGSREAFTVCLVGYTNAGKSTLMNALTKADVLAQDRLFATLDTRTSRLFLPQLPRGGNVVLSDTVGFIRNLPPSLIASFHATLAEVREADLLLHVVDASSQVMDQQIDAVEGVLAGIGAGEVPVLMVFNKCDRAYSKTLVGAYRKRYQRSVAVSALLGDGLDELRRMISDQVVSGTTRLRITYPVTNGAFDAFLRSRATILEETAEDDRMVVVIGADPRLQAELDDHPDCEVAEV